MLISYSLLLFVPPVRADYVLPYPSYMPGNKLYRVSRVLDSLKRYWYFGSIASFRYHLGLADKYLVEAKTLFEYKQYALAVDALKRSDVHVTLLPTYHKRAVQEGKDVSLLTVKLQDAMAVHGEVINRLIIELPEEFHWTPEKEEPTLLPIRKILAESIAIRQTIAAIVNP